MMLKTLDESEVSQKTKDNLMTAKFSLITSFPFISFLSVSIEYKYTNDIPTLGASTIPNNRIYINPEFFDKVLKNNKERTFVIAHEMLHIFLDHISRQRQMCYDPMLFNVAADFCINGYIMEIEQALRQTSSDRSRFEMPKMALHDLRFKGMSADEIYHLLLQESKGNAKKSASKYGAGETGFDKPRPLDELPDEEMPSEKTRAENRQRLSAAMAMNKPQDNSRLMGTGAAGLIREFEAMFDSKMNWRTVLGNFVDETAKSYYTYNKISRKSYDVIFPSLAGKHLTIAVGIDTSGSMSESDLVEALTEVKGIMESFDSWKLTLMSCDTEASVIGTYESESGDDFTTVSKALIGGGGTDMYPMVQEAERMDETPACLVIITDGYIPPIEQQSDVPTIFVVTTTGNKDLKLENYPVIQMNDAETL